MERSAPQPPLPKWQAGTLLLRRALAPPCLLLLEVTGLGATQDIQYNQISEWEQKAMGIREEKVLSGGDGGCKNLGLRFPSALEG